MYVYIFASYFLQFPREVRSEPRSSLPTKTSYCARASSHSSTSLTPPKVMNNIFHGISQLHRFSYEDFDWNHNSGENLTCRQRPIWSSFGVVNNIHTLPAFRFVTRLEQLPPALLPHPHPPPLQRRLLRPQPWHRSQLHSHQQFP